VGGGKKKGETYVRRINRKRKKKEGVEGYISSPRSTFRDEGRGDLTLRFFYFSRKKGKKKDDASVR